MQSKFKLSKVLFGNFFVCVKNDIKNTYLIRKYIYIYIMEVKSTYSNATIIKKYIDFEQTNNENLGYFLQNM